MKLVSFDRVVVAMGTSLRIELCAGSRRQALLASESAVRAVEAAAARLSSWREDSELSQLNRTPVGLARACSGALLSDLQRARRWSRATGGAFDPAVGALIDLYELRGDGRWPSDQEVWSCLPHCSVAELEVVRRSAVRAKSRLRLDAGAFGKGAALDEAGRALTAAGVQSAVLDFGGQVLLLGERAAPFDASIADPRDRLRPAVRVQLDGPISFATTANSERRIQVGSRSVGHILDPRTGRPAQDFGSVTVWAETAFAADCLSTALFVMGPDAALTWAEQRDGIEALVLHLDDEQQLSARATSGLRGRLEAVASDLTFQ